MNKRQRKKWRKLHPTFSELTARYASEYYKSISKLMLQESPVVIWFKSRCVGPSLPSSVSPSGTIHVVLSR